MPAAEGTHKQKHRVGRWVAVSGSFAGIVLIGGYLLLTIYVRTPSAARQVSRLLSDYLHYPVTVAGLDISAGTFSVSGLAVASPPGFKERTLVSSRVISITPGWRTILRGSKSLGEISLTGLRITIDRNERGDWNFSELARHLPRGKGGGETFIKRLAITDSSLAIDGVLLDNLALNVSDLSTGGTNDSRFLLTFKDAGGTPVRLEGGARLGPAPSLDLVLSASSFYLKHYQKFVRKWPTIDLSKGMGAFKLGLNLHEGKIAAEGKIGVDYVALKLGKGFVPVKAELEFRGRYDIKSDEATLDACAVRLDEIVRMNAAGSVRQVRKAREFAATVSFADTDMRELVAMLPQELRGNFTAAGTLSSTGFRCSGNAANGITAGDGKISLSRVALAKGGRLLLNDLAADISLVRGRTGWEALGRVSQGKAAAGETLQDMAARFSAAFSSRMKPLRASIPAFAARLSGIPVQGKLEYRAGAVDPVAVSLDTGKAPVTAVNSYLAGRKVTFSAGTVALAFQASGRGPKDFTGRLRGGLHGIQGRVDEKNVEIKDGAIEADFRDLNGYLSAGGNIRCSGALPNGKMVTISSAFGIRGRAFSLSDGSIISGQTRLHFAGIGGTLPLPVKEAQFSRIPLRLHLEGISGQIGEAGIGSLAGDLGVDYVAGNGRRWFAGSGVLAVTKLAFKGRETGSLQGRLKFTEKEMVAQMDGILLDGRLNGTAALDPFDPKKKTAFNLRLEGAQCAGLTSFGPVKQTVKITGGLLDAQLAGAYSVDDGLRCRVEAKGKGIALTGKKGQMLLTDGTLQAVGDVARDHLFIREGVVGAGTGTALKARGEVARFLSPDREGEISFSLPTTPLDSLRVTVGSALPPGFREASASGTMGAQGTLRLSHMNVMLDGEVSLEKAGFEIPAQKVGASGMTGTIPFSFVIAGKKGEEKKQKSRYPQEPYAVLLSSLRQAAKAGHAFSIGKLRFGGMELGETALGIRAGNGLIEITSLESKFLEGALLGRGYFRSGGNMQYGAELALNELSLRSLCSAFPKIQGYISGKVDGTANLYGEGKGMNGLIGIVDIWTRSARDEKMLVSKEFLQKLAGKKLKGIFFQNDRPYDHGAIHGYLEKGYLVFDVLDISHTNFLGVKDLSVSVAPVQNKIAIDHLIASIKEAATRGKAVGRGEEAAPAPPAPADTEFKWEE